MKKAENAYFTVEAAMVLPVVIFAIVLLIYLAFYQYNRCVMEQDMGWLALKGCIEGEADKEILIGILDNYSNTLNENKFMMWKMSDVEIKLERENVEVTRNGELHFPFSGFGGNDKVGNYWTTTAVYKNQRINPVDYIRIYRKITGGK